MIDLKGKKLLICEEALIDYKGHFYSWIKAIRQINKQHGAQVFVAGSKDISLPIKEEFNVIPAYTHNNWSGIYDYPQSWKRYLAVLKHNSRIYRQTKNVLRKIGKVDCIILPASRIYHLIAWLFLCRFGLGKSFDRVVIFILTSEAVYDKNFTSFRFKKSSLLMQTVLKALGKYVRTGRVVLAGDSHITCKEYESMSGIPFKVFPSPAAGLQASTESDPTIHIKRNSHPTFVILGVSVIDKGIDLLQDAILQILEKNPTINAKFI
ncbi:MAG: hypothetical protein EOP48_31890, partial [Sphingobacteriales bacterium]